MKKYIVFLCLLSQLLSCGGAGKDAPSKSPPVVPPGSAASPKNASNEMTPPPATRTQLPQVPAINLDNYAEKAKKLIGHLEARDYDPVVSEFDSQMAKLMDKNKLTAAWEQLGSHTGKLKKQVSVTREVKGHYQMISTLCEFEKAFLNIKMTFNKDGLVSGLFFAPAEQPGVASVPPYVQADRIVEEQVTIGDAPFQLPGVLCMPKDGARTPAAVLVHGSGPNDRDETIGPNKPFRDLANGLCSAGFAVLRYDKRTKVHAGMMLKDARNITLEKETSEDVKKAVAFLKTHARVQPDKIFVIGHSLGAMATPGIARDLPELAGIVLLAGNSRPLEDLILDQVRFLSGLDGTISAEEKQALDKLAIQAKKVKDPNLSPDTPAADLPLGLPAAYWIFLGRYDVVAVARALTLPILILQGERDYQVTLAGDFARWKKELGKNANVKLQSFPDLNHLFMKGEGTPGPSEYMKPGHVAAEVITTIVTFMQSSAGGVK